MNEATMNESGYRREGSDEYMDVASLLEEYYDTGYVKSLTELAGGIGSRAYYVIADNGEYILKDIDQNPMNNPDNEVIILKTLKEADLPVSEIYPTKQGESVLRAADKVFHLQKFIEGTIFGRNQALDWLLYESARMLGKIQKAMEKLSILPVGISQLYFDKMTPDLAQEIYSSTLELALSRNDTKIADSIRCKMVLLNTIRGLKFDVGKMTCKNTHGDYKIQQLVCGKDRINAVIDFTSACRHPVCWELMRSYSLTDSACDDGSIDIEKFKKYVSCFLEYGSLNPYDIKIMPYVYYYQILVSDYFGQYYHMVNVNRQSLLDDAFHTTEQCKWFANNIEKIENSLIV